MGTIIFKGKAPFELDLCNLPTAKGEGENVLVTLPVLVTGNRQDVRVAVEFANHLLSACYLEGMGPEDKLQASR
jgi:hypothetical protein